MFQSLYLHIPYCSRKCFYCDFSTAHYTADKADAYLAVLERELTYYATHWEIPPLATLYLGGGTPSLLTLRELGVLFDLLRRTFSFLPHLEWSLEGSPDSLTREKLCFLRQNGVNRLSLGVQSFHDVELAQLGRTHTAEQAVIAYEQARAAGFTNLSLDLIFAIPGQTETRWDETLSRALALAPDHFSLYNLMIEEGTYFHRLQAKGKLLLPNEEMEYEMYRTARERLTQAGYEQYEISSFARPGKCCRHNVVYWLNEPYLGVGVSSHSFVGGRRFANSAKLNNYLKDWQAHDFDQALSQEEEMKETLFMGFRLTAGVDKNRFLSRFHVSIEEAFGHEIDGLLRDGLLCENSERYMLSSQGLFLANLVFQTFA